MLAFILQNQKSKCCSVAVLQSWLTAINEGKFSAAPEKKFSLTREYFFLSEVGKKEQWIGDNENENKSLHFNI